MAAPAAATSTTTTTGTIFPNNLYRLREHRSLCKAFGIKLVPSVAVVQIAQQAGFDALFIDLEHSTLSIHDASQLCSTALLAGVTPFVRVPHQCGNGLVQRVLDGGAMGVIFPHVSNRDEAVAAVCISKYPPLGKRSMTGQLPQFSFTPRPHETVIQEANAIGSTVFVMIETQEGVDNVNNIAQVDGVDVLLVGSNDLSIELGVPARFESEEFRAALERVGRACSAHGKIMGLAGIYDRPDVQKWAIETLGVGFLLAGQDAAFIAKGARQCVDALKRLQG